MKTSSLLAVCFAALTLAQSSSEPPSCMRDCHAFRCYASDGCCNCAQHLRFTVNETDIAATKFQECVLDSCPDSEITPYVETLRTQCLELEGGRMCEGYHTNMTWQKTYEAFDERRRREKDRGNLKIGVGVAVPSTVLILVACAWAGWRKQKMEQGPKNDIEKAEEKVRFRDRPFFPGDKDQKQELDGVAKPWVESDTNEVKYGPAPAEMNGEQTRQELGSDANRHEISTSETAKYSDQPEVVPRPTSDPAQAPEVWHGPQDHTDSYSHGPASNRRSDGPFIFQEARLCSPRSEDDETAHQERLLRERRERLEERRRIAEDEERLFQEEEELRRRRMTEGY